MASAQVTYDDHALAEVLAGAIRIDTSVYPDDHKQKEFKNAANFRAFHRYLEQKFPTVHSKLKREVVNNLSLLYTWEGSDRSLDAIIINAHMDVVTAPPDGAGWTHKPFSGDIADGFVWGRGALDMKNVLVCAMFAIENLLRSGYARPKRTVYLCFGHDEEILGIHGARNVAKLLESRGVKAFLFLDEGGVITRGIVPGVETGVALVGICEKGDFLLKIECTGDGGHASMPAHNSPAVRLARALVLIEEHPMHPLVTAPLRAFLHAVVPHMPVAKRLALSIPGVGESLALRAYQSKTETSHVVQSTIALTTIEAGVSKNVVPSSAKASLNVRVLPGQTIDEVIRHVKRIVKETGAVVTRVEEDERPSFPPAPVTDIEGKAFRIVQESIKKACAPMEVIVAPYCVSGGTDSKHFHHLCSSVCRFSAFELDADDLKRIHGIDERVAVSDLGRCARFYAEVLRAADAV